jgi:hypothetical protein
MLFAPPAILALLLFVALGGAVVRWLWNWLLPPLFGWPLITFWQALGLLCLCRILFGGLGRHVVYRPSFRGRMVERWMRLKPEEREQLRQAIRARFGRGTPTGDSTGNDA